MNDEQLNTFNTVLKEQARRQRKSGLYEELSRLNDELVKKNTELERLNAQKNQLLGTAAHDLGAPLSIIIFYLFYPADSRNVAFYDIHIGENKMNFMIWLII